MSTWLTSRNPEPPVGTVVETEDGERWLRWYGHEGPGRWFQTFDGDPETWTKVAGNYGPVKILTLGDEAAD